MRNSSRPCGQSHERLVPGGGHLETLIAVLGGLADVERDLIRARTAEGRSRAQKRRAEGATLAELARSYHVGKRTISRLTT
jgi:DNA invertase Pin-like site-specific DNA recombinase